VGCKVADAKKDEGARVVDLAVFRAHMPIPAAKTKTTPPAFTADDQTPCFPTGAGNLGADAAG